MLDNRTFRTKVITGVPGIDINDYIVDTNKNAKMLGEEQWKWLENELLKPADLRIILTSTQFVSEFNGYELWALKPYEKQRMIDLIKKQKLKASSLFLEMSTLVKYQNKLHLIVILYMILHQVVSRQLILHNQINIVLEKKYMKIILEELQLIGRKLIQVLHLNYIIL